MWLDIVVDENIRLAIVLISWSVICFFLGIAAGIAFDILQMEKILRENERLKMEQGGKE